MLANAFIVARGREEINQRFSPFPNSFPHALVFLRYAVYNISIAIADAVACAINTQEVSPAEPEFMRAAETLTGAPISTGDDVELLINGDEIFPAFLETIKEADTTRRDDFKELALITAEIERVRLLHRLWCILDGAVRH